MKIFTTDYYPNFFLRLNGLLMLFLVVSVLVVLFGNRTAGIILIIGSVIVILEDIRHSKTEIIEIKYDSGQFIIRYAFYNEVKTVAIERTAFKMKLEAGGIGRSPVFMLSIYENKVRLFSQYANSPWNKDLFEKIIKQVEEIKDYS